MSILTRAEQEAREAAFLAPYAFHSAQTRGRAHAEPEHPYRGLYQRDRDRIVHSTAFRRLEYKTQVFVNHEGDYYRTRLTHTMEVAQIARSIARALRLNEDLTECVALAHDLGHTPFGHSGEEALGELMAAHGGFEHNRQSLRIVELLEHRYPDFPGLNLSQEVRDSIACRMDGAGRVSKGARVPGALLEAQVVDLADALAYAHHDLDDGLKAGFITLEDLASVELWARAWERAHAGGARPARRIEVHQTLIGLLNELVTGLLEQTLANIDAAKIDSVDAVHAHPVRLVAYPPRLAEQAAQLAGFLHGNLYRHYRVMRMARKARSFVVALFKAFVEEPSMLPPNYREWCEAHGLEQGVADYIAGMTDRYAQEEYVRIFQPFERV